MNATLQQVTESEFFAALKADPRDIMPSAMGRNDEDRFVSEWRANNSRRALFGVSDTDGNFDNRYWLVAQEPPKEQP